MRKVVRGVALWGALFVVGVPLSAAAQGEPETAEAPVQSGARRLPGPAGEPGEEDVAAAREHFIAGTEAADEGRWADALESFEEAYRLSGIPVALYNAATTLRSLGRYRDARDAFRQLLEDPELDAAVAQSAQELLIEVSERVGEILVLDLPPAGELSLRLNGSQVVDDGERPLSLETDPGAHSLRIERPAFHPFLWEGEVPRGGRATIRVEFEALPEVEEEGGNGLRNGLIIGGVAAVVIAGAVTAFLLLKDDGLQPMSDNVVEL